MPRGKKEIEINQGQVYGYLRVSTEEQKLDNNKDVIQKKKDDLQLKGEIEWIEEKVTGTLHWKKRELGKLLDRFNEGDILIISELSRISRKYLDIQEFIIEANKKKVKIYSLDIPKVLDGSIESNIYLSCIAIGAQLERDHISVRTKVALAKKKKEYEEENIKNENNKNYIKKKLGRPIGHKNKVLKLDEYKYTIQKKIQDGIPLKRLAEDYKVSQQTMCNYVSKNNLKDIKIAKEGDKIDIE
jgi:DNA invertase Pin-like site-specific DNA recombinase